MKRFNFRENSTLNGVGLGGLGASVVVAGLDILSQGASLVGLALVVAGLAASVLGAYAAYRPD